MTAVVAYKWASNPQDASVSPDGVVDWSRAKPSVSEYDPIAILLARQVADANSAELVGISIGSSNVASSMAKKGAMSRGMDRGIVLADDAVSEWNSTQVAAGLAQLVGKVEDVDIVFTGDASIDESAKMMSSLIAGYLQWPCFQNVKEVVKNGTGWTVTQNIDGGTRTLEVSGPVVVAVAADALTPKVPGMKDILAAGKKPVEELALSDLTVADVPIEVTSRSKPERRARKNQLFSGDAAASELIAALKADGLL